MPQSWEQYIREQELAAGPEDGETVELLKCEKHGETFDGHGFCGSCYVAEIQEGERLAAEWKKSRDAER
jgi:hypothetical protein